MIPAGSFTAPSLVMRLRKAKHDNRLDTEPEAIGKAEPPVIDELGYLPGDIEGVRLLFQVIADSYETRGVASASKLESDRRGDVFGDAGTADRSSFARYLRTVGPAGMHLPRNRRDGLPVPPQTTDRLYLGRASHNPSRSFLVEIQAPSS